MSVILEASDLNLRFGGVQAANGASLKVSANERIAIIGKRIPVRPISKIALSSERKSRIAASAWLDFNSRRFRSQFQQFSVGHFRISRSSTSVEVVICSNK